MVGMRTICATVMSAPIALALPFSSPGQTDVRALQDALHGKQLGLRSYSADAVAQYKWVDGVLATGPVALHGLEAFLDDSVKLKGGKIVFQGNRVTLVRNGTNLAAAGRSPMSLEVDLQGADPAVVIPQLQAALFFPHLQEAIDGLPGSVSNMLPFPSDGKFSPTCKCAPVLQNGVWGTIEMNSPRISSTKIMKGVPEQDPDFKAMTKRESGSVSLIYVVSETGQVSEIWVALPLGFRVEEFVARRIRMQAYLPAKLDGKPVGAVSTVTMSFR
jgi:hypothetical protein